MSLKSRIAGRDAAPVTALLGPTNTGKTHAAVQRMLQHGTGMMGFPLRLLAREVYDRVCQAVGPDLVALVTGEEKRVPPNARYYLCTVEAMPLDRPVAFVAVDEVQLAGDRARGHVFTDRILHARGVAETMFLGSDTMAPLLEALVPEIIIEGRPRLSTLTFAGSGRVRSLPSRSALVAFSVEGVYALAEQVKAAHGGAAVVLGALSPRARNAQVAMYQAGEVRHLVATDAIGMGLNLDVRHVAFAGLGKFDGRAFRGLSPAEVAQIAGRAGRYRTPGTFGTLPDAGVIDPLVVAAVEAHQFEPVRKLWWRNSALDFSSLAALHQSLLAAPPRHELLPVRDEDDQLVLEALLRDPALVAKSSNPAAVRLLWRVCSVPDFRKTRTDSHAGFLAEIAHQLLDHGLLDAEAVRRRVDRLDRLDGDIDTLMGRMAWVRTWTYLTFQADWLADAAGWQAHTRYIEDRLSDALHDALTARFVDRRVMLTLGAVGGDDALTLDGDAVFAGAISLGELVGFSFRLAGTAAGSAARSMVASIARQLAPELERRVQAAETDDDAAFTVDDEHQLRWRDTTLAVLSRGDGEHAVGVRLVRLDLLTPAQRDRLRARTRRWLDGQRHALVGALDRKAARELSAAGKGLVHAVRVGLGSASMREVHEQVDALSEHDRAILAKLDLRLGTQTVYVHTVLKPDRMRIRAWMWAVREGVHPIPALPEGAPSSVPTPAELPRDLWDAVGYRRLGPRVIRFDVLERLAAGLRRVGSLEQRAADPAWLSWLGCTREELAIVLNRLGFETSIEGEPLMVWLRRPVASPAGRPRVKRRT